MKNKIIIFSVLLMIICFLFLPFFKEKENINVSTYTKNIKAMGLSYIEEEISAKRAILIDKNTGFVLYSKNPDEKCGIASTTKILTAIIVIENTNLNDKVTISKEAVGIEGSSIYLTENEIFTVSDLLYGLLLESGNDSAVALAIHTGGSIENFAKMMNNKAKSLGMENSNFTNSHGLSSENHYSTARDMGILTCYAMENEIFREIVSTKQYTITPENNEKTRYLINHNKLLWRDENISGVKTGYTISTGRCLVSAYDYEDNELICVTLDSPDHWNDHEKLFEKGIKSYKKRTLTQKEEYALNIHVVGGKNDLIKITNTSDIILPLPENAEITFKAVVPQFVYAPIEKGDIIGEVRVYCEEKIIYTFPLYATESVEIKKISLFKKIFGDLL